MLLNHGVAPVWLVDTAAASLHSKVKNFSWNSTGQNKFHLTLVKLKMKLKKNNTLNLNQGSRKLLNTNESGSIMWPGKGRTLHRCALLLSPQEGGGGVRFCFVLPGVSRRVPKSENAKNMKINQFCIIGGAGVDRVTHPVTQITTV